MFCIAELRVVVTVLPPVPTSVAVSVLVSLANAFFEEGSDIVCDPLEFFIALSLSSLQTTSDMSSNKRHGDSAGA